MRIASFAVAVLLVGCGGPGEKTVTVTGTLTKGGQPFTFDTKGMPPGDPGFRLEFTRLEANDAAGEVFPANFSPSDGTFSVRGAKAGVPPGKYRVTVEKGPRGVADQFKAAYTGKKALTAEVPDASKVALEVDLDKRTVTVK